MNTVLAIYSKPFELQTSVFYTRQTILSSLRVIETKLDDRCTVWELWRHKHLADLIFSRKFDLEPFYQGQLHPLDYCHVHRSICNSIVVKKWGRLFFYLLWFSRKLNLCAARSENPVPAYIWPPWQTMPPPRNFVKLFFTSSRTYLEVI